MANFHGLLAIPLVLFSVPAFSQGVAPIGAIDLAGWIKGSDGAYTKAFGDSVKVNLSSPPSGISTTSTALINTSKGVQAMDIVKTATVDLNRVGAAVGKFAQRVGPVGMTLTAVSLVCELTTICDQAGQWMRQPDDTPENPNSYPVANGSWTGYGGAVFATPQASCSDGARISALAGAGFTYDSTVAFDANTYKCYAKRTSDNAVFQVGISGKVAGCANNYSLSSTNCLKDNLVPVPVTQSDWDSKTSLMNDDRFIPELINKGESVPSGVPTLTADQKKGLGLDSKPTRDSNGNVTGREDTTTEIEAVDAASADTPGRVIIKETQTTVKYDLNNNVVSSNTNTSYSSQPQPSQPQPSNFEIKFDEVPPAELQTHVVPVAFTPDSWGAGTCPPDVEIAISLMTFSIPSQPVCSTAEMINPFVLTLASIMAIYIISGVRGGQS